MALYAWGSNNDGELGIGDAESTAERPACSHVPLRVWLGGSGVAVAQVSCGSRHCVARDADGNVYSWGWGTVRPPAWRARPRRVRVPVCVCL